MLSLTKYLNKLITYTYNKSYLSIGVRVSNTFRVVTGDLCGMNVYVVFQSTVSIHISVVVSLIYIQDSFLVSEHSL